MSEYDNKLTEITCIVRKYEDGEMPFMKYMKELNGLEADTIECGKKDGRSPIQIYREVTLARANGRKKTMRKKSKDNIKPKRKTCPCKRK